MMYHPGWRFCDDSVYYSSNIKQALKAYRLLCAGRLNRYGKLSVSYIARGSVAKVAQVY